MIEATGKAGEFGGAFAAIWQTRVQARFASPRLRQASDYLKMSARRPDAVTVELDPYAVHRLVLVGGLRCDELRILLAGLTATGVLTPIRLPPRPSNSASTRRPCHRFR